MGMEEGEEEGKRAGGKMVGAGQGGACIGGSWKRGRGGEEGRGGKGRWEVMGGWGEMNGREKGRREKKKGSAPCRSGSSMPKPASAGLRLALRWSSWGSRWYWRGLRLVDV